MEELEQQLGFGGSADMATKQKFYERLSEIYTQWIPLENVYYRNLELGTIEFENIKQMSKWPDLNYYHVAAAKNGGPIGKSSPLMCFSLHDHGQRALHRLERGEVSDLHIHSVRQAPEHHQHG